jgi:hypothetical protein
MSPDIKTTLTCGNRAQRDAVRRIRHAWHAEGQDSDLAQEAALKLMCWNLAGAQAKARPMRWLFFATDPGSTVK